MLHDSTHYVQTKDVSGAKAHTTSQELPHHPEEDKESRQGLLLKIRVAEASKASGD